MATKTKQSSKPLFEVTFNSRLKVSRERAANLVAGSIFVLIGYKKAPKAIKSLTFKDVLDEVKTWPDVTLSTLASMLISQVQSKPLMPDVYMFLDHLSSDCNADSYVGSLINSNIVREYGENLPEGALTRLVDLAVTKALMESDSDAKKAIKLLESKGYKVTAVQR